MAISNNPNSDKHVYGKDNKEQVRPGNPNQKPGQDPMHKGGDRDQSGKNNQGQGGKDPSRHFSPQQDQSHKNAYGQNNTTKR